MFTVHVLQGPDKGLIYHGTDEPTFIGRTSDQVQLSDESVSRSHAEIRPDNGAWGLVDLSSSNGTFLNGQRITGPTPLKHGDQIKVGNTLMVFGGQEQVESFTGPKRIREQVDLDLASKDVGSSILSSVAASEESVILQSPETADAVAAWNVVYRIAEMIGSSEPASVFLDRVADVVFDHLIVDRLVLLIRDSQADELNPQVVRYRYTDRSKKPKIVTSRTIINHVLQSKQGVLCANAMTDERFTGGNRQDSIHSLGLRSIICVPILIHEEVLGIIHLDCSMSHHTYTQEQLRLAAAIGKLTGMAIENTRLLESRVRTERLAAAGETVAYLSHHIRNIVQGLQGGAEVVELGIKKHKVDTIASGWSIMKRNLDHIVNLAMNMLTFSKDRQPRVQDGQLNKTVEDVVSLVQARADEKSVMILSELEDIPTIPFDAEGMHQVAHNILLNAIDAAPEATGRVNIRTTFDTAKDLVVLSISDNGPGIEPDKIDKVFEAFQSSKGQAGTGLGLAAARKIMGELNGSIEIDTLPGEGTTFHVKLPTSGFDLLDSEETLSL